MSSLETFIAWAERPDGNDERYSCVDMMAVEIEVGEMLYALVRALKPEHVVESGTGAGISAYPMALALQRNGEGTLDTYEPDGRFIEDAKRRLSPFDNVSIHHGPLGPPDPPVPDMVFLDSGPEHREREMAAWMDAATFLIVHDAHREYTLEGGFLLDTARGLWFRDNR